MAGFIRRYGFFPGAETIALIEGVIIVDLPPPASIQGVGVGTVGIVGEFQDVSTAVTVSTTGAVTSQHLPVEVFSAQDMLNKVGGWDATLGDFGTNGGNGFVALRNKQYSRLVIQAINFASPLGTRLWRQLPTNASATDYNPAQPMQAAVVSAGYEFKTGLNRVRSAKRHTFTDDAAYAFGIDGVAVPAGLPAATQNFNSPGANFSNSGVAVGDILVIGALGAAPGPNVDNAFTYRVTVVVDANNLTIERIDGSNFTVLNWTASVSLVWRLHVARTADSGLNFALSGTGGYVIPARPLDAAVAQNTNISPTVAVPALTATSWDPLSGLTMRTHPTAPGLAYTAATQAANVVNSASVDALYTAAIDGYLLQELPAREVNLLMSARLSTVIRAKLKSHVLQSSSVGVGRVAVIAPPLTTVGTSAAIADVDPGVGANRDERVFYCWPGAQTFIPEAVNTRIKTALGTFTTDGILDVPADAYLVSVCSNLPPERNPGQAAPPVPQLLASILGLQRGVFGLQMPDYIQLRQKGIVGLRIDRTVGPIFQSGVTTSLIPGQKNINRRRMADFIEDSLAQFLVPFAKLPLTNQLKDGAATAANGFLEGLLSPNNPPAQRINAYQVDTKSGNTPEMEEAGIYVLIVRVRTTPTADFIVVQAEIGEGVVIRR